MTDKLVQLASVKCGDPEFVATLREIVDRFERGEISEIVIATSDRVNYDYRTYGHWQDRWRLLGAIKNAKMKVLGSD